MFNKDSRAKDRSLRLALRFFFLQNIKVLSYFCVLITKELCKHSPVIHVVKSCRNQRKICDKTPASNWREAKSIHTPEAPAEDRVLGLAHDRTFG